MSHQVSGTHSGRGRQAGLSRWQWIQALSRQRIQVLSRCQRILLFLLLELWVAFVGCPRSIHTNCHVIAKVKRRSPKWRRGMRTHIARAGTRRQEGGRGGKARCSGRRKDLIAPWNTKPLQLVPYPITQSLRSSPWPWSWV